MEILMDLGAVHCDKRIVIVGFRMHRHAELAHPGVPNGCTVWQRRRLRANKIFEAEGVDGDQ